MALACLCKHDPFCPFNMEKVGLLKVYISYFPFGPGYSLGCVRRLWRVTSDVYPMFSFHPFLAVKKYIIFAWECECDVGRIWLPITLPHKPLMIPRVYIHRERCSTILVCRYVISWYLDREQMAKPVLGRLFSEHHNLHLRMGFFQTAAVLYNNSLLSAPQWEWHNNILGSGRAILH